MNKKILSYSTLLISLTLVIFLYPKLQNPAGLKAFVAQWGLLSVFVDLAVLIILALFPVIPFVLMAGINILLFGWIGGFLLSLSGSLMGASLGFWLARTLGQTWAQPKMTKLGKWSTLLRGNSFSVVFLSRLVPVLPAAAVNYAAGLSLMSFPSFLLASLLGKVPMIVWESWVGHDLWRISHHPGRLMLALAIGAALFGSVGLYWYFTNKYPKRPPLH